MLEHATEQSAASTPLRTRSRVFSLCLTSSRLRVPVLLPRPSSPRPPLQCHNAGTRQQVRDYYLFTNHKSPLAAPVL